MKLGHFVPESVMQTVLAALLLLVSRVYSNCTGIGTWKTAHGIAYCRYVNVESYNTQGLNLLNSLETHHCCQPLPPYNDWYNHPVIEHYVPWHLKRSNSWNKCPLGFFLGGWYQAEEERLFDDLKAAVCVKPSTHPDRYHSCYELDLFSKEPTTSRQCGNGYFIAGVFSSGCTQLECLTKLYCCQLVPVPDPVYSIEIAKSRAMQMTRNDLRAFAYYLGYVNNNCDMKRVGESWLLESSPDILSCQRTIPFIINYSNWRLKVVDLKVGESVISGMDPVKIKSGYIRNRGSQEVKQDLRESTKTIRKVKHIAYSDWLREKTRFPAKNLDLSVSVLLSPAADFQIIVKQVSANSSVLLESSYKPTSGQYVTLYDNATMTYDSTGHEEKETYERQMHVTIPAKSVMQWDYMLQRSLISVSYEMYVSLEYSVELQGRLGNDNHHSKYQPDRTSAPLNFTFGDSQTSFTESLKQKSELKEEPWMWDNLLSRGDVVSRINRLCNESRYLFKLRGSFNIVKGDGTTFDIQRVQLNNSMKYKSENLHLVDVSVDSASSLTSAASGRLERQVRPVVLLAIQSMIYVTMRKCFVIF